MKKIILILSVLAVILSAFIMSGCERFSSKDIIRIHIRANSNSDEDQSVKYLIKDKIVEFITPLSKGVNSKDEMYGVLNENLAELKEIADNVLNEEGFPYKSAVYLKKEEFPLRTYDGITFPEGAYDALIVKIGEGAGDNWWCVAFPPLCFIGAEDKGGDYFRYKSKIYEILNG
jgi:stage II sporulation protein R